MKKIYISLIAIIILFFISIIYILQDSQNKITLKIKSSIPKEVRYFMKNGINTYLYYFGINFKFANKKQIRSSDGKLYNTVEYNNKFLDYQGPRSYLGFKNDRMFLVTGTGLIGYTNLDNLIEKKNFKIRNIKTNIKDIVTYDNFYVNSNFGTKGMLIDENDIYLSLSNEIEKNCYSISVIKSKIDTSKLDFSYIFKSDQCVKKLNDYGEFQPIQSGGMMSDFDENYFLLTTGEFRYRDHAQNDESIFGKVLLINKINGDYKIISKGHRNSQGIYYDKKNEIIVSTEHGPLGGDEVNINKNVFNKNNYGWPISSYGEHYPNMVSKDAYEKAPLYKSHLKYGFIEPIKYFVPSIGISQILKVENSFGFNQHQNYFFSSMSYPDRTNARSIHQLVFDKNYENILFEDKIKINYRIRDIIFIPKFKIIVGYLEKRGSLITLSENE